jgi:hypothetical protein
VTHHLNVAVVPPSQRTCRIAELEAVLRDLREFPVDAQPYVEEVRSVEADLLHLLRPSS